MMTYAKIIAISVLICAISTLPVQNDDPGANCNNETKINYRLPNSTAPIHYDLKIIPDINGDSGFKGESIIHFKVLEPTSDIVLHSVRLNLDENATRVIYSDGIVLRPEAHTYINTTDQLIISAGRILEEGEYWITMRFSGHYKEELHGFFKSYYVNKEGNNVWLVATDFEPTNARYAFPCWDEPALKATFNISIKHYDNYTALSNMPVREITNVDEADDKRWTHFEKTPVMSTYLVAYVVADFEKISNADGSINIWSRKDLVPHLKYALEIAQKATRVLEQYTNSTVRVPKMDHVALPQHGSEAMENWGLITYSEIYLVFDESKDPLERKQDIAKAVAHELAHQWFGNKVSPIWWSHIWLNEGFASYFQHYTLNKIYKNWREMDYFVINSLQDTLVTDPEWHTNPIDVELETPEEIISAFSIAIYKKAPSILHMLSNIISPEVFQKGIVDYLDRHEYDSADPDCLWSALQSALDKSNVPHSDFNVKEVMDTWIKQKRYPLVTVERNYSTGEVKLRQEDFALVDVHIHANSTEYKDEKEKYQWWVPITYATESNPDFSDIGSIKWLKPQEVLTIDGIDPDDWIIVNKQQSGYYRVNYDEANWRKIAEYLRSENYTNIHTLSRAQFVSDITRLVFYERVKPSVFLDLIVYLKQEQDYTQWIHVFDLLENIKQVLDILSAQPIRDFILSIMENLIKTVGYDDNDNEDPLTQFKRHKALYWACYLGHTECKEMATIRLAQYMNNPDIYKKSPELKEWAINNGLQLANESVWYQMWELCLEERPTFMIYGLGVTENPTLFQAYLNITISNDIGLTSWQRGLLVEFAMEHRLFSNVAMDFCIEHWNQLGGSSGYDYHRIYEMQIIIMDEERIEKIRKICENISDCNWEKFWAKYEKYIKQTKSEIEKWIAAINDM
nr:aminopeptidase N-like isoform X2 [Osmia lignaria]